MPDIQRRTLLAAGASAAALAATATTVRAQQARPTSAISQGLAYFRERATVQADLCNRLTVALQSGDIEAAENAYEAARPPYEEIEVHAGAFVDIDAAIDARPYAIEGGETSADFRGFHRIEALIYRDRDLETAVAYAQDLEVSVRDLAQALSDEARFDERILMDGMLALSEEVASKKISSEEETWSDLSMIIFRHNFIGIESQFSGFRSALASTAPVLVDDATAAFMHAQAVLEPYFDGPRVIRYSDVRAAERGQIVRAAYGIRDVVYNAAQELDLV